MLHYLWMLIVGIAAVLGIAGSFVGGANENGGPRSAVFVLPCFSLRNNCLARVPHHQHRPCLIFAITRAEICAMR